MDVVAVTHFSLALLGAQAPAQRATERIVVSPAPKVVLGDSIHIRLEQLSPNAEYDLVLETSNEWGTRYQSINTFRARASGEVDLSRDAPIRGSYDLADAMGIFWSATRAGSASPVGPLDVPADSLVISLALRKDGAQIATTQVVQWLLRPGSRRTEIRDSGIVAALYQPANVQEARPLVVLIGGSGGGMTWQRVNAAVLASHGYAALAVAYFRADGLPAALAEVPLEYFRDAIRRARRYPGIDPTRVAVIGLSYGAQAALLAASEFPDISAVVAYAPSHVAFMGQRPPDYPRVSAWTLGGRPLSFVPTQEIRRFRATDNEATRHLRYLVLHSDSAATAVIPVERIRGPVLLFSGDLDPLWPATFMAELITARLESKGFAYKFDRIAYDSAGHAFARQGYQSTSPGGFSGGFPRANAHAQVDSWNRTLAFLAEWANSTSK
jgi:dienelactone hydrolase